MDGWEEFQFKKKTVKLLSLESLPTILAAKLEKQCGSLRRQEEMFAMEAIVQGWESVTTPVRPLV